MAAAHGPAMHSHDDAGLLATAWPGALLLVVAAGYAWLAYRRRTDAHGWSPWRTSSFLLGIALLLAALVPPLSPFAAHDFRGHMYQHLLIGMYAPLALVLGAPITLILRSIPRRHGRTLSRVLRSAPARFLAHPVSALLLMLGGVALLYFTPLYGLATGNAQLHALVHLHFFLAGYLFAHAIAGPDPAPHRPSVPARLVILGAAIAGHAVLAQLLYANAGVQLPVAAEQLRGAAEMMYYGGDIAELLLALAMVSTWRPAPRARTARAAMRNSVSQ